MVMIDAALPGELSLYKKGIKTLVARFPNDWGSIAAYDESMRAEQWSRLHQEILDGSKPRPGGFKEDQPWGAVISESRFGYLQGPMADWWREREVQLERGQGGKLRSVPLGGAVQPSLPSFSSVMERQVTRADPL